MEKFLHMRNVGEICHMEKVFHMRKVEKICHVEIFLHMRKISFMRFMLFCREICFVAIYTLLCGEKLNQKLCQWRKKTNIRYGLKQLKHVQSVIPSSIWESFL